MACYHPLEAYQLASGGITFHEASRFDTVARVDIPCGRCVGCRLERAAAWALRCTHEAKLHDENCFVTLTYDNEHLPLGGSLRHRDVQLFLKRLRKSRGSQRVRYYMCGEYGEKLGRPHYHICFFGLAFPDRSYVGKTESGSDKFLSAELQRLWGLGDTQVSDFTFKAAAYTARYLMEKQNGDQADKHYWRHDADTGECWRLVPEYNSMSKGNGRDSFGLGYQYLRLYYADILSSGTCVVDGREVAPPRYYDKKMRKLLEFDDVKYARYLRARKHWRDTDPARLAAREKVALARLKIKKRHTEVQ